MLRTSIRCIGAALRAKGVRVPHGTAPRFPAASSPAHVFGEAPLPFERRVPKQRRVNALRAGGAAWQGSAVARSRAVLKWCTTQVRLKGGGPCLSRSMLLQTSTGTTPRFLWPSWRLRPRTMGSPIDKRPSPTHAARSLIAVAVIESSLKFHPGRAVLKEGTADFPNARAVRRMQSLLFPSLCAACVRPKTRYICAVCIAAYVAVYALRVILERDCALSFPPEYEVAPRQGALPH